MIVVFCRQAGRFPGDARVTVIAGSIFAGDFFQPLINNTNGSIGGDATVSVQVTGNTSVGTEGFFRLRTMRAASVEMRSSLLSEVTYRSETHSSPKSRIARKVKSVVMRSSAFHANNLSVTDTANFQILNGLPDSKGSGPGGLIGGDATNRCAVGKHHRARSGR